MKLFTTLRRNARLALKGNRGTATLLLVIQAGVGLLLSLLFWLASITLLGDMFDNPTMHLTPVPETLRAFRLQMTALLGFLILSWIVLSPLRLGVYRWYRALVYGEKPPLSAAFYYYESGRRFLRALGYTFQLYLRSLGWAILFLLPPAGTMGMALYFLQTGEERRTLVLATMALTFSQVLMLLCALLCAIFLNRYALAAFLLCEDDTLSARAALRTSIGYTKGYRFSLLFFLLCFAGWGLLSVLTLGLALFYTLPYFHASFAMYSRYLVEKNRYIPNPTREFVVDQTPDEEKSTQ